MQKTRLKITEAATLYGIARTTIYKKIKDGKLSVDAEKKIDLSEMMRVFGAIPSQLQTQTTIESVAIQENTTLLLQERIASLEKALAVAVAEREKVEQDKEWLKQQFEQAQKQVEQAQERVKLLEHKPSPPPPPKNGLFNKLVKAITG